MDLIPGACESNPLPAFLGLHRGHMLREVGSSLGKKNQGLLSTELVPELGYDSVGDPAPPWRARHGKTCVKSSPGKRWGQEDTPPYPELTAQSSK